MKNRTYSKSYNQGKFFCRHVWTVSEKVGPNWDISYGVKILCKCTKCGKLKYRSNSLIEEIDDKLIHCGISYHF